MTMGNLEKKHKSEINVFITSPISSHPYLKLLYGNLENIGIVCHDFKKMGDIQKIFVDHIIHLHWIEFHIRSPKGFLFTYLKFACYAASLVVIKYILRKKIVITLHNIRPHEILHPRIEYFSFLLSLNVADAIITHNEWSKKAASELYKISDEKIYVIPIGNFIGYYPNKITKEEARKKLDIPMDTFVLLYFGLIRKYKGLDLLLSALGNLQDCDILSIICGKPDNETVKRYLENFKKNNENCLLELTYISDDEIQFYMNAADVGILPYEEITTSAVLLLFASFKKTVIASDLEPIRETLGDAAIYYNPGNLTDLKRAIIESKKMNLDSISEASFQKAYNYKWENIAMSTYQVYRKVMK